MTASLTHRLMAAAGLERGSTEVIDSDYYRIGLPSPFLLPAGHYVEIVDADSIDNSSDVLRAVITYNAKGELSRSAAA
jgi:hypothetical protein